MSGGSGALDLDVLARGLRADAGSDEADAALRQAAVACIFHAADDLRVLLMRRAAREGDRWSGQVSFPGGHAEERDADLGDTAMRETREEVGVRLDRTRLLGRLPTRRAKARGRPVRTAITPFVFRLEAPPPLVLGPEAAHAFWFPLERAANGDLDDELLLPAGGGQVRLPAWRFESDLVWGLTYEMLRELADAAARGG